MSGLRVDNVTAGYGRMDVLRGIDVHVEPGEIVALLGRNGAGKTTLLRTIAGLERPRQGRITLGDRQLRSVPWSVARAGVSLVLEGARVLPSQTVDENIRLGLLHSRDRTAAAVRVKMLLEAFPILASRSGAAAGALSGGERMQLAIVQAVAASPRYLLLDEPSVGLSPSVTRTVFDILDGLRRDGEPEARMGILVAEQMVAPALRVVDRALVIDHGAIAARGTAAEMRKDPLLIEAYLGTAGK